MAGGVSHRRRAASAAAIFSAQFDPAVPCPALSLSPFPLPSRFRASALAAAGRASPHVSRRRCKARLLSALPVEERGLFVAHAPASRPYLAFSPLASRRGRHFAPRGRARRRPANGRAACLHLSTYRSPDRLSGWRQGFGNRWLQFAPGTDKACCGGAASAATRRRALAALLAAPAKASAREAGVWGETGARLLLVLVSRLARSQFLKRRGAALGSVVRIPSVPPSCRGR